jgi:hypothetical protein
MSSFSYQVIKDTTEHAVIKLTGRFTDGTQESNVARIAANTLAGALATNGYPVANVHGGAANTALSYYGLAVNRIWYDCSANSDVELYWHADADKPIVFLSGTGEYNGMHNWVTIPNNTKGAAGCLGDIGILTRGMAADKSYTIMIELRKENEYYSRGQFVDPAAFNYGEYSLKP